MSAQRIADAFRDLAGFYIGLSLLILSYALMFSAIIPWALSALNFLQYGVWGSSAEAWIQENFRPEIDIAWIGVRQLVEWALDTILHPFGRFAIGTVLAVLIQEHVGRAR